LSKPWPKFAPNALPVRDKFYRQDAPLEKFRADIEAGRRQVEEGKVSDFDPEAVKRRGREKLARLRNAKR
jgi:hypothetical protein